MAESMRSTAQQRIKTAFLALMREKPYTKITVTEIVAAADVNRATFYRHFEDTRALFKSICRDVQNEILSSGESVTDEAGYARFLEGMNPRVRAQSASLEVLAGENGDVLCLYDMAGAIHQTLSGMLRHCHVNDPSLIEKTELSLEYASVSLYWYSHPSAPEIRERSGEGAAYDPSSSFFYNLASFLSSTLGGSVEFHYTVFVASTKLFALDGTVKPTVTALLHTAGCSRTEFYKYYSNIDDFNNQIDIAIRAVTIAWGEMVLHNPAWLNKENLDAFFDPQFTFTEKALFNVFVSGRIGHFYQPILSGVAEKILALYRARTGRDLPDGYLSDLFFYIIMFTRSVVSYFMGGRDFAALSAEIEKLRGVRRNFGIDI